MKKEKLDLPTSDNIWGGGTLKSKKNLGGKKKIILLIVGILISIGVIAGISYAWWTYTGEQESVNKITSDCLKLELKDETGAIQLEKAYPITDEEASNLKPYVFTIRNTCNTTVTYDISLEIMEVENRLKNEYIALSLDYGEKVLVNTLNQAENTYNKNAIEGKHLTSGTLNGGESERYSLRLWMDEHVTINDDAMNKNFRSKIVINASMSETQEEAIDNTIMAYKENTAFWSQRANITKVIITKDTSVANNASYTYDVSAKQNGSVMSYLIPNTSDASTYTMYIKSENGVTANANSAYLFNSFTNLESIEGLEYLDTSNVTHMQAMFANMSNLTSLDLSSFVTSKVTNMYDLFINSTSIANLDISSFDTSSVTNMTRMFYGLTNLKSLDVTHFNTSNVTNMSHMFYDLHLDTIDVSHFDTSKVTNMAGMFLWSRVSKLDLSNFDTSNVTDMNGMFRYMPNLTTLNISSFDTSNVTNMRRMFNGSTKLTSLDLSHFNTSKVTDMSYMFDGQSTITNLNIKNFDTSNVTDMTNMYAGMPSTAKVYVRNTSEQQKLLNLVSPNRPTSWTTSNVVVAS